MTPFVNALRVWLVPVTCLVLLASSCARLSAEDPPPAGPRPPNRVFVPLDELDSVVEQDKQGVILPRDDYQKLFESARKNAESAGRPATPFVLSQAVYKATLEKDELAITATIDLTQFAEGWQAIALPCQGVAVESAKLDDKPARLGRSADGKSLILFSDEPGKHTLQLQLSTSVAATGSDRAVAFRLPAIASATFEITLPSGKYLHVAGQSLLRTAADDKPASYVVAIGGKNELVLRITDRPAQTNSAAMIFASSQIGVNVEPEELTCNMQSTVEVFGAPVDHLEFVVPKALDIVSIESTGLERWEILPGKTDATTRLTLTYRQAFQESRTVNLKGIVRTTLSQPWRVPTLNVEQATSHVVRVRVQHPDRLRLQLAEASGVTRVVTGWAPDTPQFRQLYFTAWQPDFSLSFVTLAKEKEVQITVATRLDVDSRELLLRSSIAIQSRFAPLFEVDVSLPAEWTIIDVNVAGQAVAWRVAPLEAGLHQVRIPLTPGVPADGKTSISLSARHVPTENWPVEDKPLQVSLPEVRLPQAAITEGTYMIASEDDLEVVPEEISGLNPAQVPAEPGVRLPQWTYDYQDSRFSGRLKISRKPSHIASRTTALYRLDRETLVSHLESELTITGGGVRRLQVSLPESAGEDLRFRLLGTTIRINEQSAAAPASGQRVWTIELDQRARGQLVLAVDLQQPRGKLQDFSLPALRIVGAERQADYLALEASPDQQLAITALNSAGQPLAEIDPGEFPRLRANSPRERIVGVYLAVTPGYKVNIKETRFDQVAVPTAICDTNEVSSVLGESGELQHRATFDFRAVGVQSLSVQLPSDATLWATLIDGQPVESRRFGTEAAGVRYLVPVVPAATVGATRHLQLFYRTQVPRLAGSGSIRQQPPAVAVINGAGETQPLEILSRNWKLYSPGEVDLTGSQGEFEPVLPLTGDTWFGRMQNRFEAERWEDIAWKAFYAAITVFVIGLGAVVYRKNGLGGFPSLGVLGACLGVLVVLAVLISLIAPGVQSARSRVHGLPAAASMPAYEEAKEDKSDESTAAPMSTDSFSAGMPATAVVQGESNSESRAGKPVSGEPGAAVQPPTTGVPIRGNKPRPLNINAAQPPIPPDEEVKREMAQAAEGKPREQAVDVELMQRDRGEILAQKGNNPPAPAAPPATAGQRGLLSLPIDIQVPTGSRETAFEFSGVSADGNSPELEIGYQSREGLSARQLAIEAGIVLLCWFLRRARRMTKVLLAVVGLAIPVALAAIAPLSIQPDLEGIFIGTAAGGLLWLMVACASCCCMKNREPVWRRGISTTSTISASLLWAALIMAGSQLQASEEKSPVADQVSAVRMAKPATPTAAPVVPVDQGHNISHHVPDVLLIPYEPDTNPGDSERVFLPFQKFVELWNAAHPDQRMAAPGPVAGLVTEALYAARVVEGAKGMSAQVDVTARFVLYSFRDEQIVLPLPLGQVALTSAKLDDQAAPIISEEGKAGTQLKIAIAKRGLHILDVAFKAPAELTGPAGKFTLPLKPVATGSLRFTLPGTGSVLQVNGAARAYRQVTEKDATVAIIPISEAGDITVSWRPAESREQSAGMVSAESVTSVFLDHAGIRIHAQFTANGRQGPFSSLSFSLPAALRLREVTGSDVGGWELSGKEPQQILKVILRRSVSDTTRIAFDLFLPQTFSEEPAPIVIPQLAPAGIPRETGTVGVFAGAELKILPGKTSGLTQIDVVRFVRDEKIGYLPKAPDLAYRFIARPIELQVIAQRHKPRAVGASEHALLVTDRTTRISSRLELDLSGSPRSEIAVRLPPGYLLYDVASPDFSDFHVETQPAVGNVKASGLLRIDLAQPRTGKISFALEGVLPRDTGDLAPQLSLPTPTGISELRSAVAIWLDPMYSANIADVMGWKSIDPIELPPTLRAVRTAAAQFAFTSTLAEPQPLGLVLKRNVPRLSADSLTAIIVERTAVQYLVALQWKIASAAETTFRFTTPDWLEGRLDLTAAPQAPRVRQIVSEKIPKNRLRWTITLEEPIREKYFVTARATFPPPAGASLEAPLIQFEQPATSGDIGEFTPLATQQHYLMLVNQSPNQLIRENPKSAEPVGARDLPIQLSEELALEATEILKVIGQPASVAWRLQTLQEVSAIVAAVNLADITLVLAEDGSWRTTAEYLIKNRARQFLALQLPPGSRVLSLFVAGKPSRPVHTKRNDRDLLLVPLPKTEEGALSTEVKIVCAGSLGSRLPHRVQLFRSEFELPAPQVLSPTDDPDFGIPVAQTSWTVYLPRQINGIVIDDPSRTNVTQSAEGEARFAAEIREAQDIAEELTKKPLSQAGQERARRNLGELRKHLIENNQTVPQIVADNYWDEERYGKVPIQDPVQAEGASTRTDLGRARELQRDRGNSKIQGRTRVLESLEENLIAGNGIQSVEKAKADSTETEFENSFAVQAQKDVPTLNNPNGGFQKSGDVVGLLPDESKKGASTLKRGGEKGRQDASKAMDDNESRQSGSAGSNRRALRSQVEGQVRGLNADVSKSQGGGGGGMGGMGPGANVAQPTGQFRAGINKNFAYGTAQAGPNPNTFGQYLPSADSKGVKDPIPGLGVTGSKFPARKQVEGSAPFTRDGQAMGTELSFENKAADREIALQDQLDGVEMAGVPFSGEVDFDAAAGEKTLEQRRSKYAKYGRVAAWSRSGGLSLPIAVPAPGHKLTFSKIGGDPRLTLGLRTASTGRFGLGITWAAVCLILAVALVVMLRRTAPGAAEFPLSILALIVGLAWFLLLPFGWIGFVLLLAGALKLGWISARAA